MVGRANEMAKAWKNNPQHWEPIKLSEAQEYANKGYFVVAGYEAPKGSGHVVVILSGTDKYSSNWECKVPVTMDTGGNKRWNDKYLSDSFSYKKKMYLTYYYYKH